MNKLLKSAAGIVLFASVAALFAVAGCSSTNSECVDVCNRAKECGTTNGVDCDQFCSDVTATAADADCSDQYTKYVDCQNGLTEICKLGQCTDEGSSVLACVAPYCAKNQTDPGCKDVNL